MRDEPGPGALHGMDTTPRTQIVLSDAQYARLLTESERTGLTLTELVRRAIDARYAVDARHAEDAAPPSAAEVEAAIDRAAGMWADRPFDGAAYVEAIRGGRPLTE